MYCVNEVIKIKVKQTAFTKLFNIVFTTGIVPEEWSHGIISPIYKKKQRESN